MPGPAAAGAAAAEGAAAAGLSASDKIAIVATATGTALGISALPSDTVTIGNIGFSLAPQGDVYVGDRIVFTAQIDVSYGDVYAEGGKIKIELIEQGTGVLHVVERASKSAKESFSMRYEAKTISHGTKLYYVKVTATGDDDVSYWPVDYEATRERESDTVSLEVKKPIVINTVLLTPGVNHGKKARALMKTSNLSESEARYVSVRLDDTIVSGRSLRPEETDVRIIDHLGAHSGDNHEDEQTFFFEPVKFFFHAHKIELKYRDVWYNQIAPDHEILYDPIPVTCKGGAEKKIGYVPDGWDKKREREGEYAYACAAVDGGNKPLACSGVFSDLFGNSLVGKQTNKRLQFRGALVGEVGVITLTPENPVYQPYSFRVPLDPKFLKEYSDRFIFYPAPIPAIQGMIFIKSERLPVERCVVELKNALGKVIYRTMSGRNGRFTAYVNGKDIEGNANLVLNVKLPWDITFGWKKPVLSKRITKAEILNKVFQAVNAEVLPREEWVSISGAALVKNRLTKKALPVKGVEIALKDETGEMRDKAVTDEKGRYALSAEPGRYFIEVINAGELGYNPVPPKVFTARNSRKGADIKLSVPAPFIQYQSPEVVQAGTTGSLPSDKLVLIRQGRILKEYKLKNDSFYIKAGDVKNAGDLEIALLRNGVVSAPVEVTGLEMRQESGTVRKLL